jgi:hypothetical protein
MQKSRNQISTEELDALILKAIEQPNVPLSLTRLRKALPRAYRLTPAGLRARIEALRRAGSVHAWPRATYGPRPFEDELRGRVLAVLALGRPMTRSEIQRAVRIGGGRIPAILRALVAEGRVHKHPRLGRRDPYAAAAAEPDPYVQALLHKVIAAVARQGFAAEAVKAAILRQIRLGDDSAQPSAAPSVQGATGDAQAIIDAMVALDPRVETGALVYMPHVRYALSDRFRDKLSFDRVVLAMAAQRRVQVQSHPVPSQLTAEEREAMVPNGVGGFYNAIGLRPA